MEEDRNLVEIIREHDVMSKFLKTRRIFLWGPIDDEISKDVVGKLLFLESEDSTKDISVYINSPGGSISSGLAIYDAMQNIEPDISTICMGIAMSMGAVLLAAGTSGKRYAWPHSRMMIHQPLIMGRVTSPASDIEIEAKEIIKLRDEINQIFVKHTGQPKDKIDADTDRNFYVSAEEAVEYGLIDEIIGPKVNV